MRQTTKPVQSPRYLTGFRTTSFVALGANQPSGEVDVREVLRKAISEFNSGVFEFGVIRGVSRMYQTPAFPPGSGPDFVNAAVAVDTDLDARDVLRRLHGIEASFGRERAERWGPRTLDLDLIALGDQVLPDAQTHLAWRELSLADQQSRAPDQLILPHPRMHERAFVLIPLADIAPDWVHPLLGPTVAEMVTELPDKAREEVVALE